MNLTEILVKDPIFSFIRKMISSPDSYLYTLVIAFSENWKFSKAKFEKFLWWVNLDREWVFSFSQNKDYFKMEVINCLEKIIVEDNLNISDENLRRKIINSLYNYVEWKIADFDTIKKLIKLLG